MALKHYLERRVAKATLSKRFAVSRRIIHLWVKTGEFDRDRSSGSFPPTDGVRQAHK